MSRRRRRGCIAAASVVILAACGIVALRTSTPVSTSIAVERFRAANATPSTFVGPEPTAAARPTTARPTTAGPLRDARAHDRPSRTPRAVAATAGLPARGVYVYRTSGWEEVDVAGRREYPSETTVTVQHTRCGYTHRWDVLAEHWSEQDMCVSPGGDALVRYVTYIEHLRHGEWHEFTCDAGTLARPGTSAPSATEWTGRCASDADVVTFRGRVVGREPIAVGGTRVDTIRYQVDARVTGRSRGWSRIEVWTLPDSGLAIHKRSSSAAETERTVTVRYREEYEISLVALEPRT